MIEQKVKELVDMSKEDLVLLVLNQRLQICNSTIQMLQLESQGIYEYLNKGAESGTNQG